MAAGNEPIHDEKTHRFTLSGEGGEAVLEYRLIGQARSTAEPAAIDFVHTYVPSALRGRGLAERLVRHGLKWARDEGYEIRASCSYVQKFLR